MDNRLELISVTLADWAEENIVKLNGYFLKFQQDKQRDNAQENVTVFCHLFGGTVVHVLNLTKRFETSWMRLGKRYRFLNSERIEFDLKRFDRNDRDRPRRIKLKRQARFRTCLLLLLC